MFRALFILLCASTVLATEPARIVADLSLPFNGTSSSTVQSLTQLGDLAFFIAIKEDGNSELWRTDGTPEGTQEILVNGQSLPVKSLTRIQNRLYFTTANHLLGYLSDQGTPVVTDVAVRETLYDAGNGVFGWDYEDVDRLGKLIHFSVEEGVFHYPALLPGTVGIPPFYSDPIVYNGKVYVLAGGFNDSLLLLVTDGTPNGTGIVTTLFTEEGFASLDFKNPRIAVHGDFLYLQANYRTRANTVVGSVWVTDGISANTHLVERQELPSAYSYVFTDLTAYEHGVAYTAVSEGSVAVHVANATGSETLEITRSNFIARITPHSGGLLFLNETGLQRLDGTTELTKLLNYPFTAPYEQGSALQADEMGRFHLLTGLYANYWVSDGSLAGTRHVTESDQVYLFGEPISTDPVFVNGHLIFSGGNLEDGSKGLVSLASSGDWQGISIHLQMNPTAVQTQAARLGDRTLYLDNFQLRSTTGNPNEAVTLAAEVFEFKVVGNRAYFWITNLEMQEAALWVTDGTLAHTTNLIKRHYAGSPLGNWSLYPSDNLVYFRMTVNSSAVIWRTDGTLEGTMEVASFEELYSSALPRLSGDGVGGLYYVEFGEEKHRIWHINRQETSMRLLTDVPRYPTDFSGPVVEYRFAAGRAWLNFLDQPFNGFEEVIRTYHVWTSDGTAQGTLLFADRVSRMEDFRERNGMASFTLSIHGGGTGYVLTSGAEALTRFSPTPAEGQIDEFNYRETGTRYGVNENNGLWVNDGSAEGLRTLLTLSEGLKPYLRLDTEQGTLLVLREGGSFQAWITDGTAAGTQQVFSETERIHDVVAFDGKLYVTRTADGSSDLKLYRVSENAALELVPGSEPFAVLQELIVTESNLYFYGTTQDLSLKLLSIESASFVPELVLSYRPKFRSQWLYEVSTAPIEGASFAWRTEGGSLFQPGSNPSVYVMLDRSRRARVHLTVTLANGTTLKGEVLISAPLIHRPGSILFKKSPGVQETVSHQAD